MVWSGVHIMLFVTAVYLLSKCQAWGSINAALKKYLLATSVIVFLINTTAITIQFLATRSAMPSALSCFIGTVLCDPMSWREPTNVALLHIQIMVVDGLLLWRCFIVWNRNKILLFLLLPAFLAEFSEPHVSQSLLDCFRSSPRSGLGIVHISCNTSPGWLDPTCQPLEVGYFLVLCGTNLIFSGLIAGRILWLSCWTGKVMGNRHNRYLRQYCIPTHRMRCYPLGVHSCHARGGLFRRVRHGLQLLRYYATGHHIRSGDISDSHYSLCRAGKNFGIYNENRRFAPHCIWSTCHRRWH
ncbi:hypothetical protein NEOLEDRAFT_406170 [Neolentinus lepideus HHB14362 ss-1]|uniref:Uncharacterized protein n=1 Tax=Neolentinus lepideus HHB14362 ss-1 TaxID=1314782 RepID=A0A165S3U6_9AGAM|nr:hypothetical protein NEOLEDRAFT_406170 [Neolentinus lepideus HHB14362 ss-1]